MAVAAKLEGKSIASLKFVIPLTIPLRPHNFGEKVDPYQEILQGQCLFVQVRALREFAITNSSVQQILKVVDARQRRIVKLRASA